MLILKHNIFRCDADPAALSKYVLALIKKDKPLDDLKESMSQQMDVFLQVRSYLICDWGLCLLGMGLSFYTPSWHIKV